MKVTSSGVPLDSLIEVVKASIKRAGISRTNQDRDVQMASVQLILQAVASGAAGGGLDFRLPFIGMKLRLGARVTRKDTHTVDITLIPPEDAGRQTRGAEDIEDALVNAITSIRALASQAATGNDPWLLSEGTIDISFAITATGTITLGIEGELSDEITHTLRLRLTPPAADRTPVQPPRQPLS